MFSIVFVSLLLATTSFSQTPAIKIVSPPDGTVVAPGQKVTLVVTVDPKPPIPRIGQNLGAPSVPGSWLPRREAEAGATMGCEDLDS